VDSTSDFEPHPRAPRRSHWAERALIIIDRRLYQIAQHWLWLLNAIGGLLAVLPFAAPLLGAARFERPATWIDRVFSLVCAQEPNHTFHVLGRPMACCERCLAIYCGLFIFGLAFGLMRKTLRPASTDLAVVLSGPMLVDGASQLAGLRQSDWALRLITGSLFALALAWWLYPRLDSGFADICDTLETRFRKLAAEGRATPL
jgi:uncharacterized membrane protein